MIELRNIYSSNNCDFLINETKQYTFRGKTISITGVDDFIGGNADIQTALINYKKSDHHIILNHCPQYSDEISRIISKSIPCDLMLSGHTHGGQINFFGFTPILPRGSGNYVRGWYRDEFKNLYVSKGIGTSIIPVRFMSRAEVAVFHLTS